MSYRRVLLCRLSALGVAAVLAFTVTSWADHPLQRYVFGFTRTVAAAQKPAEVAAHFAFVPLPPKRPVKFH